MNEQIVTFIQRLEFLPDTPTWRDGYSEAERILSIFAHFMADHAGDGLWNVVCSGDEFHYVRALKALDADWAARAVQAIAAIDDIESSEAVSALDALYKEVERRHSEWWSAATSYAIENLSDASWSP